MKPVKFFTLFFLISSITANINNGNQIKAKRIHELYSNNSFLIENKKCVDLANKIIHFLETQKQSRSLVDIRKNNYGGMFISEDNTLHINQNKNNDIDFESLIPELNQENVQTTIDTVKYSLEEILKIKDAIDKYLSDFVVSLSVKQSENQISISLNDKISKHDFMSALRKYVSFDDDILSFLEQKEKTKAINSIKSGEKISYKTGWWIFSTEHWYGTVGFNAKDENGNKGIVTNYHVAQPNCEMRDSSNNLIGYQSYGVLNSKVDAAFVPFESQSNWDLTDKIQSNDSSFYISDKEEPVEGARVWSVGATSGSTYGNITSTYASSTVSYDNGSDRYLYDLIETDAKTSPGDSGGPLLTWTNRMSNQKIYGINFASNSANTYTIKINNVLNTLNVTIY